MYLDNGVLRILGLLTTKVAFTCAFNDKAYCGENILKEALIVDLPPEVSDRNTYVGGGSSLEAFCSTLV